MALGNGAAVGRVAKLLVPLVVIVGAIAGLGILLVNKAEEVKRLQQQVQLNQQQIAELDAQNAGLMQQLKNLQTERKSLDERVGSLHAQLSSATTDLERSRVSLRELQDQYEQLNTRLDRERQDLQGQVSRAAAERDEALQRVEQLAGDKKDLQRSVSRWRERLALLDRDYRKLAEQLSQAADPAHPALDIVSTVGPSSPPVSGASQASAPSTIPGTVELPPIIVRKDQAGMTSMVRGRIIEVNDAHNFVVVDRGGSDGVRIGMAFDFLRGSAPVGRATVIRVRPTIAACDIVRAKTAGPLQAGDIAVQSTP